MCMWTLKVLCQHQQRGSPTSSPWWTGPPNGWRGYPLSPSQPSSVWTRSLPLGWQDRGTGRHYLGPGQSVHLSSVDWSSQAAGSEAYQHNRLPSAEYWHGGEMPRPTESCSAGAAGQKIFPGPEDCSQGGQYHLLCMPRLVLLASQSGRGHVSGIYLLLYKFLQYYGASLTV